MAEVEVAADQQGTERTVEVLLVGAGFAGMYALHKLRGLGFDVEVVEAADGVGGVWHWNRYPGARCDIPSLDYSYSFDEELQQEWVWSERYAAQPEILAYANHVADRFDLRRSITFNTRVTSARWNEAEGVWLVLTDAGITYRTRFFVAAAGGYSAGKVPDIKGLDTFAGEAYYSHHWPTDPIQYEGKRVGVIGTGSSGVQIIQAVSKEPIEHLSVFQRTSTYNLKGGNRPFLPGEQEAHKARYQEIRSTFIDVWAGSKKKQAPTVELSEEEFLTIMRAEYQRPQAVLTAFPDLFTDEGANRRVANYLRDELRKRVDDPEVADSLSPDEGQFVGVRRTLIEDGYLETYNKPNVTLVDLLKDPIVEIVPEGIKTESGLHELDILILATGFDSGSGAVLRLDVGIEGGSDVTSYWADGPKTFLGSAVSGFPNFFMISGPGSPGIRAPGILLSEQQVEWLTDFLTYIREHGITKVEASPVAEADWSQHVAEVAGRSLLSKNDSQFNGANIPGKPRVYTSYISGVEAYRKICNAVAAADYEGFIFNGDESNAKWSGATPPPAPKTGAEEPDKVL